MNLKKLIRKNGGKEKAEELLEGAVKFSGLAANYSTVYEVWCD